MLEATLPEFVHAGKVNRRMGNRYLRAAPSGVYPTSDGEWIAIGGNGQGIFRRLAEVMGSPGLADDPRFATNQARVANSVELDRLIEAWTRSLTLDEADRQLGAKGVPAGPVMSIEQIVRHPLFEERGSIASVPDENGTQVATYRPVPRFSEHPQRLERAAGAVARDQDEVLERLGLVHQMANKGAQ